MKCCDESVHNGLIDVGEMCCPFCNKGLGDHTPIRLDSCCQSQDVINNNRTNVCRSCGDVQGYRTVNEYVDFYDSMHRFRRKSIYHRKYHVINRVNFLSGESKVQLSHEDKVKIVRIFKEIDKVLPQVSNDRKRMISIDFVLKKLFDLMGIGIKVSLSKSQKTIACHNRYWKSVYDLIGEDIQSIIHK